MEQGMFTTVKTSKKLSAEPNVESMRYQVIKHLKTVYGLDDTVAGQMVKGAADSLTETINALAEALRAEDFPSLKKTAHSLKGALLNMGLGDLADQARDIEHVAGNREMVPSDILEGLISTINDFISVIRIDK